MQTLSVVISLICRVVLVGLAAPVLLGDFPNYSLPSRMTQDWVAVTCCDALALVAPMLRWRKFALLAAMVVLGAHYYYRHIVGFLDLAYAGVALIFVLLPASGRATEEQKRLHERRNRRRLG